MTMAPKSLLLAMVLFFVVSGCGKPKEEPPINVEEGLNQMRRNIEDIETPESIKSPDPAIDGFTTMKENIQGEK